MSDKFEKILALWKFESKSGKKGLRSKTRHPVSIPENANVMIFANEHKGAPTDPDYYMLMALDETKGPISAVEFEF